MRCTQQIALPTTTGSIVLSYQSWSNVENSFEWDMHGVQVREVGALAWTELRLSFNSNFWRLDTRDLTPWAGKVIEMRFFFTAVDAWGNDTAGVYVDDVRITEDAASTLSYSACAADGTWLFWCPCQHVGGPGRGCPSSLSSTGAAMTGDGSLRVSSDTFTLHMDGMSPAAATVFQASGFSYNNAAVISGDGISCTSGSFIRLTTRFAPGGALDFPSAGDASISLLGLVAPGQTRYYAARYRDSAVFCQAATFNMTSTISAFWRP
ncbi:MAG: hypothetical protein SGI72_09190 [Planctomycetota bacterium]|nr:hypothetical protein [Planctomycetota bacterium]